VTKSKKDNPGKRPNTIDHVFTQILAKIRRHIVTNYVLKLEYGKLWKFGEGERQLTSNNLYGPKMREEFKGDANKIM
jgi:hypothetical protein